MASVMNNTVLVSLI